MRCLAVCQDELVVRMLNEILLPGFEVEFILDSGPLARRLHDAGISVTMGDPRRTDTYLKAGLTPGACIIVEADSEQEVREKLNTLPLVRAEMLEVTIIPLKPYLGFCPTKA